MRLTRWGALAAVAVAAVVVVGISARPAGAGTTTAESQSLAPYVPTPQDVVDRMLALAKVGASDVVYDLGSGDGRLVVTAAKKFGARGVGIDIDPARIAEGKANATKEGVANLVEFRQQDALEADLSKATVVTLYLLSSSNVKLRPRLLSQLKPGARIVSHQFGMGDWPPDKVETFTDANGTSRTLYIWTVGANSPKSN
ncbi:MAG TPA: class I SAM-dependent methyltransferase [Luteitalea sp.]|nr:class I SAM-dependent methyltransferase [Luteitalea sp.]